MIFKLALISISINANLMWLDPNPCCLVIHLIYRLDDKNTAGNLGKLEKRLGMRSISIHPFFPPSLFGS